MQQIELQLGGRLYEGGIQNVSKFGALIQTAAPFPVGAPVRLTFNAADGERVSVMATVVSRIDPARAVRVGIAPGIAIRYAAGAEADIQRFVRAIVRAEERPNDTAHRYEPKKTRPMIAAISSSLRFATKRERDDAARVALQGSLEDFDAATLCAAMERARQSGRLKLERADAIATVDFVDGEIVRVQSSWHHGPRQVLRDVLGWTTGSFELRALPTVRTPMRDGLRVSHLLLERARAQP
jgi:hypothetical protein